MHSKNSLGQVGSSEKNIIFLLFKNFIKIHTFGSNVNVFAVLKLGDDKLVPIIDCFEAVKSSVDK